MVEDEIRVIKATWNDIAQKPGANIDVLLYNRLSESVPTLPYSPQYDLREYCKKFVASQSYIINKLDRADFIRDVRILGKRHSDNGLSNESLEQVRQAMLWVIKNQLKERWTQSVMVSWDWYFSMQRSIINNSKYTS